MALPTLVSVVMPVRNAAETLARTLESVRRQTLREWELIVVDDGSTDATPQILTEFSQTEPRLRVLRQPPAGIVAALNRGLAAAQAPLVARMDADDEMLPARLERQHAWLEAHPGLGVAGSRVRFGGDAAAATGYALHVGWLNSLLTPEELELNRFIEAPLAHPSVMFRRELVARHGGYRDGPFPEDYELWLRWFEAGVRFGKTPEELLIWNDPPARLSRTDPRYAVEAFFACKAGYLARWLQRRVGPERALWIWGAGRPTRKRAARLEEHGVNIAGYIDIDPKKHGRQVGRARGPSPGRMVIAPEAIPPAQAAFVVGYVAKRGARELIRAFLANRRFVEGHDFILAA